MAEIVNCIMTVTGNEPMSCGVDLNERSFTFTINNRNSFTVNFDFTNDLNETMSQSRYYGE